MDIGQYDDFMKTFLRMIFCLHHNGFSYRDIAFATKMDETAIYYVLTHATAVSERYGIDV